MPGFTTVSYGESLAFDLHSEDMFLFVDKELMEEK
jgi:hypothetical protein